MTPPTSAAKAQVDASALKIFVAFRLDCHGKRRHALCHVRDKLCGTDKGIVAKRRKGLGQERQKRRMHAGHYQDGIEAADDCDTDKANRVIDPHDAGHEIRAEKGPERAYQAELERNHHQKGEGRLEDALHGLLGDLREEALHISCHEHCHGHGEDRAPVAEGGDGDAEDRPGSPILHKLDESRIEQDATEHDADAELDAELPGSGHADSDRQEVESGIGRKGKGHIGRIVARDEAKLDQKDKHDTEHAGTDQHGKDRRDAA